MPRPRASASHLFVPRKASRAEQRAARSGFAEARRQARLAGAPPKHRTAEALDPELRPTYPPSGRPGPSSAQGGKLALPAHRMTTATVSGAYPFLAEGGLGAEGIFIGRDVHAEAAFCYDPFSLYSSGRIEGFTNPNAVLAGIIGMGKSALAKSIATRAIAHGYRVYVPCDPKGEWTAVALALGGYSIALGPGLPGRLNPLDAPAQPASVSESDWVTEVRKRRLLLLAGLARTVLKRDLLPMEHTALDLALDLTVAEADATGTVPLLGEIAHTLGSPERLDRALGDQAGHMGPAAQDLAHALRRLVHGDLSGMFDAPSTVAFDPATPMLSIDLSRLGGSGDDTALVLAMTCASAWMESALADPDGGRRWVIYDEAWRVMRHVGLLERMQSQWKLSRGLGIANLMVIHRLSDLLSAGDAGSRGRVLAEGDLFYGLTGIGAYLLRTDPEGLPLERVLKYLVALTRPLAPDGHGLPGWWVRHDPARGESPHFPGGHGNFGAAHGITGPLLLLAQAMRRGIAVSGHREAIWSICEHLDAWCQLSLSGPWWPEHISRRDLDLGRPHHDAPTRPSWCYGTTGIARAGQLAGLALCAPDVQAFYEDALYRALTDPEQLAHVTDSGLCHGWAGIYQTATRAAADAVDPRLQTLPKRLSHTFAANPQPGLAEPGLINGDAGTALALTTYASQQAPITGWDACLLIN